MPVLTQLSTVRVTPSETPATTLNLSNIFTVLIRCVIQTACAQNLATVHTRRVLGQLGSAGLLPVTMTGELLGEVELRHVEIWPLFIQDAS